MRKLLIVVFSIVLLAGWSRVWCASEATITSDELELQKNGEVTIFSGHVNLMQRPYEIRADRMVRTSATAVVDATGHVVGIWTSRKCERLRVEGDSARYTPGIHVVEVWGQRPVNVQIKSEKGEATFIGDRGWVYTLTPGKAKLEGNVKGHVIPEGAS